MVQVRDEERLECGDFQPTYHSQNSGQDQCAQKGRRSVAGKDIGGFEGKLGAVVAGAWPGATLKQLAFGQI